MCISDAARHRQRGQRGFTIIELVIFIVVVSVAVVGVLGVMTFTTSRSADPQLRKQALVFAEGMLEEVQGARFTFCKPDDPAAETAANPAACTTPQAAGLPPAGTLRPYLNVTDYVPAFGTAQTYNENAIGTPFVAPYRVSVTVAQEPNLGAGVPTTESLRITVTVTYGNDNITLVGYRTRYAPNLI